MGHQDASDALTRIDATNVLGTVTAPEPWQRIFRQHVAPRLSDLHLECLRAGLRQDSPRLIQGKTVETHWSPADLTSLVVAACPLAYCAWAGDGRQEAWAVEDWFLWLVHYSGNVGAVSQLLSWIDDNPRAVVWAGLLAECDLALAERRPVQAVPG